MPSVRTAARALIVRDGLLLVASYRDEQGEWFTLPGGGQRHEEDLQSTLVRESLEETGFQVRPVKLRFVREVIAARYPSATLPADFHQVEHVFDCEISSAAAVNAALPDPNQSGCRWLALAELRGKRFHPREMLEHLDRLDTVYLGVLP
jgi:8-oxo-dGTP pyrophosphatase MutT (NUDIX family)